MQSIHRSFALVITFLLCSLTAQAQVVFHYAETDSIISNPERGLQKYSITNNSYYTAPGYSNINESTLRGWRTGSEKVTVIYRYFLLGDFMESEISDTYLENIQLDFERIRNAGLKCLVRFSYTNRQGTTPQQPVKSQILEHIAQLAPILEANQDVIVAHQAGFIGTWGEWYYTNSTEFGTDGNINPVQWQNRKEIVDAMLAATPVDIPVQVRYPQVKLTMYGSEQLDEETAYQETPNARIGFYNDAFLNVWGDMGTYRGGGQHANPVSTSDYRYLSNETQYVPMSGETNGTNPPRTDGDNAILEMDLTNWSIINRDYHTAVINGWISSGHFPEILRRLGYRFVLRTAGFDLTEGQLSVTLDLTNRGFARPFREREVRLVFRPIDGGEDHVLPIDSDIRTWDDDVTVSAIVETSQLRTGSFEVFLSIPDARLENRGEYAIRLANSNVWVADEGLNRLGLIHLTEETVVSSESDSPGIDETMLYQNYPNPVQDRSLIPYRLQTAGAVHIVLYDLLGRRVQEIENGHMSSGLHHAELIRGQLPAGTYFVKMASDTGGHHARKVILY